MSTDVMATVIEIVSPLARNKEALKTVSMESNFLKDLQVSSSRLVDIILEIEDKFGIEVKDEEADKIETVGAAVNLITSKMKN